MSDLRKVLVIPCSGIGKALGSVSREATLQVVEELRPTRAETLCLSLLTLGNPVAQERVRVQPVITVDGCPKACARVNVEQSGAQPAATLRAADTYRQHRDLKPASVLDLGPGGEELARHLAGEIAAEVDRLVRAQGRIEGRPVQEDDDA